MFKGNDKVNVIIDIVAVVSSQEPIPDVTCWENQCIQMTKGSEKVHHLQESIQF